MSCARFYESRKTGHGALLLDEFFDAADLAAQFPESGTVYRGEYRKFNLRPFPYLMFYRIRDNDILVVAVIDGRRNPRSITRSLRGR
jgi:plasmid stabilization system protein ParE